MSVQTRDETTSCAGPLRASAEEDSDAVEEYVNPKMSYRIEHPTFVPLLPPAAEIMAGYSLCSCAWVCAISRTEGSATEQIDVFRRAGVRACRGALV